MGLSQQQLEHLKNQLQKDQTLLDSIKAHLRDLERLSMVFQGMYLDGFYRSYHQSFKVYQLQTFTLKAVELFRNIGKSPNRQLCQWFEEIVAAGTGFEFQAEDNLNNPYTTDRRGIPSCKIFCRDDDKMRSRIEFSATHVTYWMGRDSRTLQPTLTYKE